MGKQQAVISEETAAEMEADQQETKEEPRLRPGRSIKKSVPRSLSAADGNNTSKKYKYIFRAKQENTEELNFNKICHLVM